MEQDHRELCLLHANCQGEPLALLLRSSPEFSARWRVRHYTNYTREAIPREDIANATLFLYQHLGPEWEELSSEVMLEALSSAAISLCIPNMFFKGYWPFWTNDSQMDFADVLLEKLLDSGAGKPEILKIYLHGDVAKMLDVDAVANETVQTGKNKEEWCAIKTAAFIAQNWRTRQLFQTVNHPGEELLLMVAQGILAHLGLPPLTDDVCAAFTYDYEGFHLPVHPKIATHFGLDFAGENVEYLVFGKKMTFAQYVSRYIDCRLNGFEESFLGYLQLV